VSDTQSPAHSPVRIIDRRRLLAGTSALIGGALASRALPALAADGSPGGRIAALQAGVERAEAVRAVKRLQHAFAHFGQCGLWQEAADLFAPNASIKTPDGESKGGAALRAHLQQDFGGSANGLQPGQLNSYFVLAPVINVAANGRSAKGRWHELRMTGIYGLRADWRSGILETDYVLEDGVWKIGAQHYVGRFKGPYESGWRNTPDSDGPPGFHYDARGAGVPIAPLPAAPAPIREPAAAQKGRLAALSARIGRLNDESLIQNLQNAYGFYVDRKMWDDVADLFADDGAMELGREGAYLGRASIRKGLDRFGPQGLADGELNDHAQICAVITVAPDGLTARARGLELGMTGVNNGGARWSIGVFENSYAKQDGVWKIKAMRVYPRMACDYVLGWGKDAQAPAQPSAAFPADRAPAADAAAPYPATFTPPFSFAHPVTGKPAAPAPAQLPAGLAPAIAEAERGLARAKAYDGAENVCNAYGYYIDEFSWDDMSDIFSRGGWKELSYVGTYVGRERIRASVKKRYGSGGRTGRAQLTLHQKIQPVITVSPDGQAARVRERLFQMNSSATTQGSYIGGVYEDECILEDGVWKISGMDLDYVWINDYAGGWGRVNPVNNARYAPPAAFLKELPPDRGLRGVTFAPFPKIELLGFHYKNPVSGRVPPRLLP
jgi:hypothetical protein